MKTGARILIEGLQREGVETIFGYPGGVVLPIYDELYNSSLRHILVRHEQAAAHAADGFARASGRVGVCLATSGPGACNLVTGIATAYMDSVPIVALTGQVPTTSLETTRSRSRTSRASRCRSRSTITSSKEQRTLGAW